MNRRGKIIATISTLCLAIVMLTVSVLAATSVSFTIGGTVAYELKDVLVDVNTNFYYSTDNTVLKGDAITTKANLVAGETLPTDLANVEGFTAKSVSTYKNGQVVELTDEEKTISGLQVKFGKYDSESEEKKSYSYYLVMEVTNHGENPVAVNVVDNTTAENVEKLATTAINFINNGVEIAKDETKKVVISFNLTDLTQSVESTDFSFAVTITEVIPTPDVTMSSVNKQDETITTSKDYATTVMFTQLSAKVETYEGIYGETYGAIYNITLANIPQDKTDLFLDYDWDLYCISGLYSHQESFSKADSLINEIYNYEGDDYDEYISLNIINEVIDLTKQENGTLNLCLVVYPNSKVDEISVDFKYSFEVEPLSYKYNKETKTATVYSNNLYFGRYTEDISLQIPETVINDFDGETYIVTEVGNNAFADLDCIVSVKLPNTIKFIENSAFSGCIGLTAIEIPNSVKLIDSSAFSNTNISSIDIPDSVEYLDGAFSGCEQISSISIGNNVSQIGTALLSGTAYYNNSSNWTGDALYLTARDGQTKYLIDVKETATGDFTVDSNTKVIAENAFSQCSNLTNIVIPDGVRYIGDSAFRYCTNLTSITIPDSVIYLGKGLFNDCSNLSIISVGNNIERIGLNIRTLGRSSVLEDTAYYNDTTKWTGDVLYLTARDGVAKYLAAAKSTISGNYTVMDNTKLIGAYAFYKCTNLTSIIIPSSVVSIGIGAFEKSGLAGELIIPNSVKIIDKNAFSGCSSITSIDISNSVTSIGYAAFSHCTGVTSITIPDTVTSIDMSAFSGWTAEQSINFVGTMPENMHPSWKNNCSAKIYLNGELYTGA